MAASDDLDRLAVTLVDLRATIENLHRAVRNAQASIEQYRHRPHHSGLLADIHSCLEQIGKDAAALTDSSQYGIELVSVLADERDSAREAT